MAKCDKRDVEIVELLRALYEDVDPAPPGDVLSDQIGCRILEIIQSTYECLEDAIYETCGQEGIIPIAKIKISLLKYGVEQGCMVCRNHFSYE